MSANKRFNTVAWASTALMLAVTLLFMNGSALGLAQMSRTMGYETRLFDPSRVHTIDIVMEDWDQFIASAANEQYSPAKVVIDGESYSNVGIRGKGNTSLSTVATLGSERYSFKIEFDQYDTAVSYHGLDKLSLNNLIQDSTMMKDYLTYTMMGAFGVAAPLCSFVFITVNGEDWGLYLAVEGIEDSFLERNYGTNHGMLYKPDSMSFGGGSGMDFSIGGFVDTFSGSAEMPQERSNEAADLQPPSSRDNFDPAQMPGGFGGFGMGSADVKLQYIDDNPESYSNIWNNAKTDITPADQQRLIASLKKLLENQDIPSVVDIEQVLRYFVVHNFVCNGDSYTGAMVHNYYLYEENGQLAMLPWDYNLAFGTFQGGSAQSTVNTPIDAPVSGGSGQDRPMWYWILSNETYTQLYHQYFAEFLDTVDIIAIIDSVYTLIKPYVEKDPSAFYTVEEFTQGVSVLRQFCTLRAESISMQLAQGETSSDMGYVDAADIALSDMGSMGGSGGFDGGMPGPGSQDGSAFPGGSDSAQPPDFYPSSQQGQDSSADPAAETSSGNSSGELAAPTGQDSGDHSASGGRGDGAFPGGMQPPGGGFDFPAEATGSADWVWLAASVLFLGIGLLIAKRYRC